MFTQNVPLRNKAAMPEMTANLGRYRLPLQLILTIPFLLQVLVTVGGLGYCFWRSGEESVSRLLVTLSEQDRHLTKTELEHQLHGAASLTTVVADDISTGNVNFNSFKTLNKAELDRLGPYLQRRRATFSPQSIVTITTQSGNGVGLFSARPTDRQAQTSPLHLEVTLGQYGKGATIYGANAQGEPGPILQRYSQSDVKLPRWVDSANNQLTWQSASTSPLGQAWLAVRSIVLPDGRSGSVATGLLAEELEGGLERLDIKGAVLVVDAQGKLIASSKRGLAPIWLEALAPKLPSLIKRQAAKPVLMALADQDQWVTVTPWGEDLGLDWRIISLVPRSQLNDQIWQNYRHTAVFAGAVLLGSLVIWTWTHQRLLKPMRRLNQAARELAIGGDSSNFRSLSTNRIGELGDLAQSLNQVALRLRDSSLDVVNLNQALFNSKKHLTMLFEALPVGVMVYDSQGRCLYLNRTGQLLLGVQQMPQVPIEQVAQAYRIYRTGTGQLYPQAELPIVQALQGKAVYMDDLEIRRREMTMPLEVRATPINDAPGNVVYAVQTFQNVITRKQAESALRQSEARIRRLAENVPGMIFRYVRRRDGSDAFTYASPHCRDIFEIEPEQLMANTGVVWSMMMPEDAAMMQAAAQAAMDSMQPWSMAYRIYTPSGQFKWLASYASPALDEDGEIYWDGVILDDTEQKQAEAVMQDYRQTLERQVQERTMALQQAMWELDRLATLDGLTQVANRRRFDSYLMQEWQRLARTLQPLSLILCDVDYFKRYNDHYGHQAGDLCLQMIAQAMDKVAKRPADLVARYGGEEFAILLSQTDRAGAEQVAEALRWAVQALAIPHDTSQVSQFVTMSIGIATMLPLQHQLPEELIKRADQALYLAKEQGRDRICHVPSGNVVAISA
jgi:diguanylate cyclase (GGDEF)-like protein/PAS domain S-box-containing protein